MSAQKTITRLRKQLKDQTDHRLKYQEALADYAKVREEANRFRDNAMKLVHELDQSKATIAAHEQTIADLEAKVKDLSQWPALAHEMARNNTRLTTTLDNMAKAAAGLVTNTQAPR